MIGYTQVGTIIHNKPSGAYFVISTLFFFGGAEQADQLQK